MPKSAVARVSLTGLALALAGVVQGCTTRAGTDQPDAYMAIPIPDASGNTDTGPAPMDAHRADGNATPDSGSCASRDLHSDVGASVATGSTTTSTDMHTPACGDSGSPDVWFTWTSPSAGTFAFSLAGSSFDTVIDVLSSCTGGSLGCNDDGPIDLTSYLTVTLGAHQTVVIVVDGLGGDSGDYVLSIQSVMPENCTNGIDDDGDTLIDCADYDDCGSNPACIETICDDGIDNDHDGEIDCLDFDCDGTPACTETICDDGIDNDHDGRTDCADFDCQTMAMCDESMHCDDGLDNDGDLYVDCADSDCSTFAACDESTKCMDHRDNDGDGEVDCADSDCAADAYCATPESNCNDGLDDDHDGSIDCGDSDCDAVCMEHTDALCMNTMDDDADSFVDCADRECSCGTACPPAVAPNTTCPDLDLGMALGDAVYQGTITPYACGARADSGCGSGGLGGEVEIAWKAPADGTYVFDTEDSTAAGGIFDTVLSLRSGCDASSTELDCSDDGGSGHLSRMTWSLTAGESVLIVVDAYGVGDGGNVTLNIHHL